MRCWWSAIRRWRRLAGWHEDEHGVRLDVLDALDEGANSGLRSGTRIASAIWPPFFTRRSLKAFSASMPGP
jgi:hypothetical protein